jgi:hypothetical protein
MDEFLFQSVVGNGIIGVNLGAVLHVIENFGLQRFALPVRYNRCANLARSSRSRKPCTMALAPPAFPPLFAVALATFTMHVLEFSADEGFIDFDTTGFLAAHFENERFCFQRKSQAVQHKPCGLLRDAQSAMNLIRTDTVLA